MATIEMNGNTINCETPLDDATIDDGTKRRTRRGERLDEEARKNKD